ncbi:MAG: TolC family protein [Planctomycetota bacterium]|nr:MAG: TolC family protein [Planctomycetota bacterium]
MKPSLPSKVMSMNLPSLPSLRALNSFALTTVVVSAISGCKSPLASSDEVELQARLERTLQTYPDRELAQVSATAAAPTYDGDGEVARVLAPRRAELDAIGPQGASLGTTVSGIVPLTAETPTRVVLALQSAVETAVRSNLDVQTAQLEKSITEADIIRAEAAFDWVVGASTGFQRVDQPTIGILFPGSDTAVIPNVTNQRNWLFGASVGKALETGGALSLTANSSRVNNVNSTLYTPDPAWSSALTLGLTQPLLRGFGTDVSLSQVHLAQNDDQIALQSVRGRLLDVVANTEKAYWALVSARARLVSAEWLVAVGIEVRDVLAKRRQFDTTLAQYANAVATVESRKALVIEARRRLSEAGNTLKLIINSPDLPVGGEVEVVPADAPSDAPFTADLRHSIETAIAKAPSIQQTLIAIENASIGVTVADNGRLPQLDLATNVSWFGLNDDGDSSVSDVTTGDFVGYAASVQFSQAIGNRAAEAMYLEARLRRSQTVVAYDKAVQGSVLSVKNAMVDCVAFRELVGQNRTYRLAQAENLRALLVDEKTLAALTPEFLQLKFQLQNGLAQAEDQYFASLVNYQSALAELQRAMGTGLEAHRIEFSVAPSEQYE